MKYLKYFILSLFSLYAFTMCTEEGESKVKSYKRTDISDFHMYRGSPTGAVEVTFAHDTIRSAQVSIYFRGMYAASSSIYNDESYEFNEGKVTCIYYDTVAGGVRQIVADYEFRNDSLYVHRSDGSWYPMAPGTVDSLHQTMGLSRYLNEDKSAYITRKDDKRALNLDDVLKYAGYADRSELTEPTDTIMWCNVKYVFK